MEIPKNVSSPPPCARSPGASASTGAGSGGAASSCARAGMLMLATASATAHSARSSAHERVLRDIGRARVEAGRAIGEIETPAADEPVVEPLCVDRGHGGVERRQPALERLGIVAAESVHALEHESGGLRGVHEARG